MKKSSYFGIEQIGHLNEARSRIPSISLELQGVIATYDYINQKSREIALHGLCRRLNLMQVAIENIFEFTPVEAGDVSHSALLNTTINIQSFIFNTFGSIDNMAWILVLECDLRKPDGREIPKKLVGLTFKNKIVRQAVSERLRAYLKSCDKWFDHLIDLRDALAHRVPPYIPPRILSEEDVRKIGSQVELGVFLPVMVHSLREGSKPILLHHWVLSAFLTCEEIYNNILKEIKPDGDG